MKIPLISIGNSKGILLSKTILERYGFKDKIEIVKGFSQDVVDLIPNELDFVYIDGDHSANGIPNDLELYYPKVRIGGLFAGHDYVEDKPPRLVVKSTVNKFFENKKEILRHGGRDWWVFKKEQ